MRLLGQPFQDFVADKKWVAALSGETGGPFDLGQINQQIVKMRTGAQKGSPLQCTVMASPIGSAQDRVTHFALGLEPFSPENNDQGQDLEEPFVPAMTLSG